MIILRTKTVSVSNCCIPFHISSIDCNMDSSSSSESALVPISSPPRLPKPSPPRLPKPSPPAPYAVSKPLPPAPYAVSKPSPPPDRYVIRKWIQASIQNHFGSSVGGSLTEEHINLIAAHSADMILYTAELAGVTLTDETSIYHWLLRLVTDSYELVSTYMSFLDQRLSLQPATVKTYGLHFRKIFEW